MDFARSQNSNRINSRSENLTVYAENGVKKQQYSLFSTLFHACVISFVGVGCCLLGSATATASFAQHNQISKHPDRAALLNNLQHSSFNTLSQPSNSGVELANPTGMASQKSSLINRDALVALVQDDISTIPESQLNILKAGIKTAFSSPHGLASAQPLHTVQPVVEHLDRTTIHFAHNGAKALENTHLSSAQITELKKILNSQHVRLAALRAGQELRVLTNDEYQGSQRIHEGKIVALSIYDHNRPNLQLVRYQGNTGHVEYFNPSWVSLDQNSFLRTPVHYTRVSSPFSHARFDPVMHRVQAHTGVDLAAPQGTPVVASGDGHISFVGVQHGYGNTVMVKHNGHYTSLYAHLSRFANGIHPGVTVHKGQLIAYVGHTGMATGPHLHYEFRINGVSYNPMTIQLPQLATAPKMYLVQYLPKAKHYLAQLSSPMPQQHQHHSAALHA